MKKCMKSKAATAMAVIMILNQLSFTGAAMEEQAEKAVYTEKEVQIEKTSEYIVQAENLKVFQQVMEEKKEDIVEEEHTEELEEQQMVVLELTEEEAQALNESKDIAFVEENITFTASISKSRKAIKKQLKENNADTDCRKEQWYLDAVHMPKKAKGKDEVKVAVLDSGISFSIDIDVAENICINEENQVDNVMFADASGHGTALAGIIAAKDNREGIRGIYPDADLYSIQVLDENNQTTLSQVIAGIYQAMEWDCDILNMSFGTEVDSELLHQAVRDAYDSGMLLIAAAGNQEDGKVEYPAAYHEVIAVGATDTTGNKVKDTSDGKEIEIFAPGTQIITTGLFGGTMVTEETSMSAAQVSGGAALLWSMDRDKDAGFIRSLLVNTTQVMEESGKSGAGLLDIENAVEQYKELEKVYQPQVLEYEQIQSDNTAEEYKGIKLVSGSWSKEGHQEMVQNATKQVKIKNDYVRLMQEAARRADADYQYVSRIHATGNYVQTLKFLYICADNIRSDVSVDNSIKKASQEAKLKEGNTKKAKEDNDLREAVRKL